MNTDVLAGSAGNFSGSAMREMPLHHPRCSALSAVNLSRLLDFRRYRTLSPAAGKLRLPMQSLFDDLWQMAKAAPFRPFFLHVSDGHALHVPTADHVFVFPTKNIVMVVKDTGAWEMIDIPNVVRLTSDGALPSSAR